MCALCWRIETPLCPAGSKNEQKVYANSRGDQDLNENLEACTLEAKSNDHRFSHADFPCPLSPKE
jgi:hypothetical protein